MKNHKIRSQDFSVQMKTNIGLVMKNAYRDKWYITNHLYERAIEKGITRKQIWDCIINGRVLEYQWKDNFERLLFRDKDKPTDTDSTKHTCVVIDLNDHHIVTAYMNDVNDNHGTLRQDEYVSGWQLDLMKSQYILTQNEKERTGTYPAGLIDGIPIRKRIKNHRIGN